MSLRRSGAKFMILAFFSTLLMLFQNFGSLSLLSVHHGDPGPLPNANNVVGAWSLDGVAFSAVGDRTQLPGLFGPSAEAHNTNQNGFQYVAGALGEAISFDGADDFIKIPYSKELAPTSQLTVSALVRFKDLSREQFILSNAEGGGYALYTTPYNLKFRVSVNGAYATANVDIKNLRAGQWYHLVGTFGGQHIRLFIDGVEAAVTGAAGAITYTRQSPLCLGRDAGSSDCSSDGSKTFSGDLDEVAVWNRKLDAQSIQRLHSRYVAAAFPQAENIVGFWPLNEKVGPSDAGGPAVANHAVIPSLRGPAGKARNADGKDLAHLTGAALEGLHFGGADDYVTIPYAADLAPTSQITIAALVRFDDLSKNQIIIGKTQNGGYALVSNGQNLIFRASVNGVYREAKLSLSKLRTKQWYQITGTYGGQHLRLYVNGAQVAQGDAPGSITYSRQNPLCLGRDAGDNGCGGDIGKVFSGDLDDVVIWNSKLTPQEVQRLAARYASVLGAVDERATGCGGDPSASQLKVLTYNLHKAFGLNEDTDSPLPAGLTDTHYLNQISKLIASEQPDVVLLEEIDELIDKRETGEQVLWLARHLGYPHAYGMLKGIAPYSFDVSGATQTSMSYVPGVSQQALRFDGVDDYVSIRHSLDLAPASQLTVSVLVRFEDLVARPSEQMILSKMEGGGYALFTTPSSLKFRVCVGSATLGGCPANGQYKDAAISLSSLKTLADPSRQLTDQSWHHLVGTFDGNNVRLYWDGKEAAVTPASGKISYTPVYDMVTKTYVPLRNRLCLGRDANKDSCGATKAVFKGDLDDVVIWSAALADTEISELYESYNGAQVNRLDSFPRASSLVGFWPMNSLVPTITDNARISSLVGPSGVSRSNAVTNRLGLGILSRFPVAKDSAGEPLAFNDMLSYSDLPTGNAVHDKEVERNLGRLRLQVADGRLVDIWVTHLDVGSARGRVRQAQDLIAQAQKADPEIPIILGGDLNADPFNTNPAATAEELKLDDGQRLTYNAEIERIGTNVPLTDASMFNILRGTFMFSDFKFSAAGVYRQKTSSSNRSDIDHIGYRSGIGSPVLMTDYRAIEETEESRPQASDHKPVVATFCLQSISH